MVENSPSIPADEFALWLPPRAAISILAQRNGWPEQQIKRTVMTRLSAGLIKSAAEHTVLRDTSGNETRFTYAPIPKEHWNANSEWVPDAYFWDTGDIYFDLTARAPGYAIRVAGRASYFGVRFDRPGIESLVVVPLLNELTMAAGGAAILPAEWPTNRGGRPPKQFWEDLLIEMFDQLWHGRLTPKTQADIERAMHDWLSANSHSASERSVRQRAKSIWKVWTKEGNN